MIHKTCVPCNKGKTIRTYVVKLTFYASAGILNRDGTGIIYVDTRIFTSVIDLRSGLNKYTVSSRRSGSVNADLIPAIKNIAHCNLHLAL